MGNSKSKKSAKEPDKFFERERWREQKRDEKRKKNLNPANKRTGVKEPAIDAVALMAHPPPIGASPVLPPAAARSFDDEALNIMRYQLRNDADAFLLNNILLSVQFFENYEREMQQIKNNPISEREHLINEAMVRHNKHIFFADRLQECVNDYISFQKVPGQQEPLSAPRLFVIYDNVEASEPGDTSDYSAVLDAPFYKIRIEDCKEPGYVKLKKLEVLESTLLKENEPIDLQKIDSDDSIYTDSEKESNESDDPHYSKRGLALLQEIKNRLNEPGMKSETKLPQTSFNSAETNINGRRRSGPTKQYSSQVSKSNISKLKEIQKSNLLSLMEDKGKEQEYEKVDDIEDTEIKPRKSILKNSRRLSGPIKDVSYRQQNFEARSLSPISTIAEDTETSGYRSNSSKNELSESESDYGYSTITEATTPKRVELSLKTDNSQSSGVLHEEIWIPVQIRAVDNWSEDEDDYQEAASRLSVSRNLYETHQYLCSLGFMKYFVDHFIMNLGSDLGLSPDSVSNALTQGASIYCDAQRNGIRVRNEVFPAFTATWPNSANQWIIRERKIIQNPRTNFSYQWPTKYMVNKTIGFGCLLVPIGFRPKRGVNNDQILQWKIIFPAAERYLESCLAHAHMRCYLFTLAIQRTFMDNESSKIGIDASHIKNHLFWQCEDNYAKWPEHRLGETLRIFLRDFYIHFGQGRYPNYFMESCNDFKSIPKPVLLKLQRKLADIIEAPVMHVLGALDKLKYIKKDFYPTFNVRRLHDILISKNPLRLMNPNIPQSIPNYDNSSESDDDKDGINFWERAKKQDKHYQWKKEKQRQLQERRKVQFNNRKHKTSIKQERDINPNIILPSRMEVERRRLVLEFFIPHFIAMARSSEKYEAIRQAVIYLEQAQRLCVLLKEEPAGDITAYEYLDVIGDKLVDCQRKLVSQVGYKLPLRRDSNADRANHRPIRRNRPKYERNMGQDSPTDIGGFSAFTFVDVHVDSAASQDAIKLNGIESDGEESKL